MSLAYPGKVPAQFTQGYLNIGAVKRASSNTSLAYPGKFPAQFTTGYLHIGAVQNDIPAAPPAGDGEEYIIMFN